MLRSGFNYPAEREKRKDQFFTTYRPLSPKMSCNPSCTRSGKPGYFCHTAPLNPTAVCPRGSTYVVQRAIGADGAPLVQVVHLAHDRGDATRAQSRSTAPDELGERAEELTLGERRLEREKVREDADDHQQLLRRVALHERQERGVEHIRAFDLVRVLAEEEDTLIDQFADNEAQDLAEISTRDQFLCVTRSEDGHKRR